MKEKKKLSKLEKCLVQEFEADIKTADRFLRDEECSLPCGSSPGMFLSELFQSCSNMPETDPFSKFAANQDDLLDAGRISILYYQGKQVQADAWSALADEPVMPMGATMPFQILPIFR